MVIQNWSECFVFVSRERAELRGKRHTSPGLVCDGEQPVPTAKYGGISEQRLGRLDRYHAFHTRYFSVEKVQRTVELLPARGSPRPSCADLRSSGSVQISSPFSQGAGAMMGKVTIPDP